MSIYELMTGRRTEADPVQDYHNADLLVDSQLPCSGCAHSASGAPFPGHPSGERPCCFCVRNPQANPDLLHPAGGDFSECGEFGKRAKQAGPHDGIWYGGTPAYRTPMDNYIATDRLTQQKIFDQLDRIERGEVKVNERDLLWRVFDLDGPMDCGIASEPEGYCCEGGPAPGGHTWTCVVFLGVSFG